MGNFFRFKINKQLPGKAIKSYLKFWDLTVEENNHKKLLKSLEEHCWNRNKVLKGYFCQKGTVIYLLPGSKLDDNSTGQNIVGLRANINTVRAGGKEDFINTESEVSKDPITNKALEIFRNNPGEFQGVMTSITSDDESVKLEMASDYEDGKNGLVKKGRVDVIEGLWRIDTPLLEILLDSLLELENLKIFYTMDDL